MEKETANIENYALNTEAYWDYRFKNDWEAKTGREQTRFFSEMVCAMLPEWLIQDIQNNGYNLCDVGCAQGDALDSFRRLFADSKLYGEDFSQAAIEKSKLDHPDYCFETADIFDESHKKPYDIIYCSNVLEHFENPREVLTRILDRAVHYAIVLIPFREEEKFHEHVVTFDMDTIPLFPCGALLVHAQSLVCESPYYYGEQALLIYAKKSEAQQLASLQDIAGAVRSEEFIVPEEQ